MILKSTSLFLREIEEFLNSFFHVEQFPENERGGIYLQSSNSIERLGLALEPGTHLDEWLIKTNLDALFLHRSWKLEIDKLPPRLGIISYHLPFDECLTVGFNLQLAQALQMSNIEILGKKENRAIGMIGDIQTQSFIEICDCITQIFGKYEQLLPVANRDIKRIAVVGAMTDSLVREAAKRGADIYITGQIRQPAQKAIQETKIGAIAVGHRRSEIWGLRSLARIIQERWTHLQIFIYDES